GPGRGSAGVRPGLPRVDRSGQHPGLDRTAGAGPEDSVRTPEARSLSGAAPPVGTRWDTTGCDRTRADTAGCDGTRWRRRDAVTGGRVSRLSRLKPGKMG